MAVQNNIDIVIITMSRWDGPYSSAILSLAKELAKTNRVFYFDHPFTLKDFFSAYQTEEIQQRKQALLFGRDFSAHPKGFPEGFVAITPKLILPVNWLPKGDYYDLFSHLNDKVFFAALRKTIKQFGIKRFIFLNSFNPFFGRKFPNDIKPELKIYQTRDDISEATYVAKHGVRLENEAVKQADLVFGTSKELVRLKKKLSDDVYLLPNAADIELFKRAAQNGLAKPEELRNVHGKVIGYFGNISRSRVDFGLLKKIAEENKEVTLLLVGPVDSDEHVKIGLDQLPNVIFTGAKKISELPAYLRFMDCTIIPFMNNKLTKSIYPLKINEYLAAGKPVVTTDFSEDINEFRDVAIVAKNNEEFLNGIKYALENNSSGIIEDRMKAAEKNSWSGRVELFWNIVGEYLN